MSILAIDLGTRTGWAHDGGGSREWGMWNLADIGGTRAARLDTFSRYLTQAIDTRSVERILVEEPYLGVTDGQLATRMLFGLLTLVELTALRRRIHLTEVNPATIKKATLGWARKKNPLTKEWIAAKGADVLVHYQRRGLAVEDENAAIALALLDMERAGEKAYRPASGRRQRPPETGPVVMARIAGSNIQVPVSALLASRKGTRGAKNL